MSTKPLQPTESELEILQILWQRGPASVRAINDRLNEQREVGYTTTLKLLQIMHEKGLVDRDTSQRSHIYRALVEEQSTRKKLLDRFVETTFRGSAGSLILQALGNHEASPEELEAIKSLIDKMEQK